jgi:uncharacterized protein YggE
MAEHPANRTISVPGEGRVSVRADLAELHVGIALTEETVQAARTAGAVALQGVLSRLRTLGIKDADIQTSIVSMTPAYDYSSNRNPPRLVGYALTNTVSVTIRDLNRIGDVIDGALTSGATALDALTFRVADPAPVQRKARELAFADARTRADTLAKAADVEITGVFAMSEGSAPTPFEPYRTARAMVAKAESTVAVTFSIR